MLVSIYNMFNSFKRESRSWITPRIVANRPFASAAKQAQKFSQVKILVLSSTSTSFSSSSTLGRIESLDFRVRGHAG
jgi:hypothetical protein